MSHPKTVSKLANLVPFQYESKEIRTITGRDKTVWFVAKDVCNVLDYSDTSMALRPLDADEKGTRKVCTHGGNQKMLVINESGLYTLILRSNKPEAKPFRKWVTSEVLPSIRKTGQYVHKTLTPAQQRQIQKLVSDKAHSMTPGKKPTRDAYMQIYRSIKDAFQVAKYSQVSQDRFEELVRFLGGDPDDLPKAEMKAMPQPPPDPCDAIERLIKELGVVPSPRKCLGIGWKKPMYIITENVQISFPEVLNINMTLRNIHYFESDKVKEKVERLVRLFAEMLTNVPFNRQEG